MASRLIVNADDFGLCRGVNEAIRQAHNTGVLTSATLMASMPGAQKAVELAEEMPNLGVGVHLNLTEGPAVSNAGEVEILLDSKGRFAFSPGRLAIMSLFSSSVRKAIEIELAAQIGWVIDNGIKPSHLDSHKHIHSFPSIYKIVGRLASRFGIGAIRWPFEPTVVLGSGWPAASKGGRTRAGIVRKMAAINRYQDDSFIRNDALLGVAHTGRIDYEFFRALIGSGIQGTIELMTHPGFSDGLDLSKTRLTGQRERELEVLCSEEIKELLSCADVELTHYGRL